MSYAYPTTVTYRAAPSKAGTVMLHYLTAGSGFARLYNGCKQTGAVQLLFFLLFVGGVLGENALLTSVGLVAMAAFFLLDTIVLTYRVTIEYRDAGALCSTYDRASNAGSLFALVFGLAGAAFTLYTALAVAPVLVKNFSGLDMEPVLPKPAWM